MKEIGNGLIYYLLFTICV